MTYLLACNLVVQHIISCNWVLPVGNIFIIIIINQNELLVYYCLILNHFIENKYTSQFILLQ
jgi:hypothetical protein